MVATIFQWSSRIRMVLAEIDYGLGGVGDRSSSAVAYHASNGLE